MNDDYTFLDICKLLTQIVLSLVIVIMVVVCSVKKGHIEEWGIGFLGTVLGYWLK